MTGRIIVANGRAIESVGRYDCDDFMAFGEPRPRRTRKENEAEQTQQHSLRFSHKSPLAAFSRVSVIC